MGDEFGALRGRLSAGDEAAFGELYDRFGPALFAAAMRILGRRADAEDAVQEVFAALVRGRRRLALVDDLRAYLFVSLRRAAWQLGRKRARLPESADADPGGWPDANMPKPSRPSEPLARALARLPAEQREVVALKIDGGLTFEQIGLALGISPNTAASRYRYALDKLRELLRERP